MYNKDTVRMMPHGGDRPVFFLFFLFLFEGEITAQHVLMHTQGRSLFSFKVFLHGV